MSLLRTFTDAERKALIAHGFDTHQPSQLSDAFVLGLRYAANGAGGYCTEGDLCNCGGDLPSIQAACSRWRGPAPTRGVMVEAASGGVIWTAEDEARLDAAIAKRNAARNAGVLVTDGGKPDGS